MSTNGAQPGRANEGASLIASIRGPHRRMWSHVWGHAPYKDVKILLLYLEEQGGMSGSNSDSVPCDDDDDDDNQTPQHRHPLEVAHTESFLARDLASHMQSAQSTHPLQPDEVSLYPVWLSSGRANACMPPQSPKTSKTQAKNHEEQPSKGKTLRLPKVCVPKTFSTLLKQFPKISRMPPLTTSESSTLVSPPNILLAQTTLARSNTEPRQIAKSSAGKFCH